MNYRKILVGCDGSQGAKSALCGIVPFAVAYGSEVRAFYVQSALHSPLKILGESGDGCPSQSDIQALREEIHAFGDAHDLRIHTDFYGRNPEESILHCAEEGGFHLIALGRDGSSPIKQLLFEGTEDRVRHQTACDVLITVPAEPHTSTHDPQVLIGYDGTRIGDSVLESGFLLARQLKSQVAVLWVHQTVPLYGGAVPSATAERHWARDFFETTIKDDVVRRGIAEGLTVQPRYACGEPAVELLGEVSRIGASLLVIGHGAHTGWWDRLLGTTVDHVVSHSSCNVLILHRTQ